MKTVAFVDDDTLVRAGLRVAFDWNSIGCLVTGDDASGEEAFTGIHERPVKSRIGIRYLTEPGAPDALVAGPDGYAPVVLAQNTIKLYSNIGVTVFAAGPEPGSPNAHRQVQRAGNLSGLRFSGRRVRPVITCRPRLGTDPCYLKTHRHPGYWEAEIHAYENCATAFGRFAPRLLAVREDEPRAIVVSALSGKCLSDIRLDAARERTVWRDAGRGLSLLHDLAKGDYFGPCHRDYCPANWPVGDDGTWAGVIDFEFSQWNLRATDLTRYPEWDWITGPGSRASWLTSGIRSQLLYGEKITGTTATR